MVQINYKDPNTIMMSIGVAFVIFAFYILLTEVNQAEGFLLNVFDKKVEVLNEMNYVNLIINSNKTLTQLEKIDLMQRVNQANNTINSILEKEMYYQDKLKNDKNIYFVFAFGGMLVFLIGFLNFKREYEQKFN